MATRPRSPAAPAAPGASDADIVTQYLAGITEVRAVLNDPNSTAAQKKAAKDSLDQLTIMLGRFHTNSFEGRTGLLLGLIHELQVVTGKINPTDPISPILNRITAVLGKAEGLLAAVRNAG